MIGDLLVNRSMPTSVVIPVLEYRDVREAVEWLCRAFGFVEHLRIGTHRAQLSLGVDRWTFSQTIADVDPQTWGGILLTP